MAKTAPGPAPFLLLCLIGFATFSSSYLTSNETEQITVAEKIDFDLLHPSLHEVKWIHRKDGSNGKNSGADNRAGFP